MLVGLNMAVSKFRTATAFERSAKWRIFMSISWIYYKGACHMSGPCDVGWDPIFHQDVFNFSLQFCICCSQKKSPALFDAVPRKQLWSNNLVCIYVSLYMYLCMYLSIYVFVCVLIYDYVCIIIYSIYIYSMGWYLSFIHASVFTVDEWRKNR